MKGKKQKKGTEGGRKKKVIKGTGRKKALSQRWTAVCDRHPGADSDVRVQIKGKKKRERERQRARERIVTEKKKTLLE